MIATRARGSCWCSTWYPACSATLRKWNGLREERAWRSIISWLWQVLRSRSGALQRSAACAAPRGEIDKGQIRLPVEWQRTGYAAARNIRHLRPFETKKAPGGRQATGRALRVLGAAGNHSFGEFALTGFTSDRLSADGFTPVQRVRPRPRSLWLIQQIAGLDESAFAALIWLATS